MGIFSKELNSLEQLFIDQLQDLYDAEHRITEALPLMAEAATSPQLAQAFREHLQETERQIERLERVFEIVGQKAKRKTCEAMKGLITEGNEVISAKGDGDVRDAALIAAAQRVEHYEIAGYGTVRTFARRLGFTEAEELLQATLDEEGATDHRLTAIAESMVSSTVRRAIRPYQASTQPYFSANASSTIACVAGESSGAARRASRRPPRSSSTRGFASRRRYQARVGLATRTQGTPSMSTTHSFVTHSLPSSSRVSRRATSVCSPAT